MSTPPEAFDESRDKVLHGLRTSNQHKEDTLCPNPPVTDTQLEGLPVRHRLAVRTLCESDTINCESVTSQKGFFLVEEAPTVGGVVGHEEEDDNSCNYRCKAFEDLSRKCQLR